ncbi:hypothetical protein THOM_1325, partial [Trachipleistophora hominis]
VRADALISSMNQRPVGMLDHSRPKDILRTFQVVKVNQGASKKKRQFNTFYCYQKQHLIIKKETLLFHEPSVVEAMVGVPGESVWCVRNREALSKLTF